IDLSDLRRKVRPTRSCGCLRDELVSRQNLTHGHARQGRASSEYWTWSSMLARCYSPNHRRFRDWGGRGISVCARWRESFENFLADMGHRPAGRLGKRPLFAIDRINNDGDYEPSNCRWATYKEQSQNRRPR